MANIPSCIAGAYSCLRVVLTFARQLSFFIFTIYIPCFMIVIVSWMSFWIDHKAVSHKIIFAKFAKKNGSTGCGQSSGIAHQSHI